jgi:Txe/YoeB family toxin of Txe-Axe toxin-antitoxin module
MMTEPENDMEREFMRLVDEARRKCFEGNGASIPLHMRYTVLRSMKLTNTNGRHVGTLADTNATILRRFRETL